VSDSGTAATIINGIATFTLTGVKTGGVAITIKNSDSTISSNAVSTRVEGAPASVKLSFDKDKYVPGEAATITVQVLDAAGLPVSGKTYSNLLATGGITSTYAFGSTSDVMTSVSVTTDTDTVKTYKVFMPLTENKITISATGGSSLPAAGQVAVTATVEVSNEASKAATKASEEALAAASDAFDAAIEAATAAQMAQSIAQEALDAVASLRKRMNKRFDAIEKLIKRLL